MVTMFTNVILKLSKQVFVPQTVFLRTYRTVLSKEIPVSQFCTIILKCPYNINIKPIDVFQSQNKAFINIDTNSDASKVPDVICNYNNDILSVDVIGSDKEDFTLNIDTSVKANVDIQGCNNINIGNFYGKYIKANTKNGHINLAKSQCEEISLITDNGDIVCKDVTQAGDITLKIQNSGKITTDRLQGLKLQAYVANGSINVGSSYCDKSNFEIETGELQLKNLHKHVTINIKEEALLNIVGFDGDISINMKKGLANIQFSRIIEDSKIHIENDGSLILRLSEECQKENLIELLTNNFVLTDTINMNVNRNNESCELFPIDREKDGLYKLHVSCKKSHVLVNSASWTDLFEKSYRVKD
ncbi:putative adhesin [Holotrichia oblita]|uniref:Adhesin n=1 Tax=Holotrichia oblita TaxID=644536 RepID=A0ACB9SX27_HOLOL|nr:putative adhesin [Holotrichia oblita]